MSDVKRLNYFNRQFLNEKDFQDEQAYHIQMRRLHNRSLHTWGIVYGLAVEKRGDRDVIIRPGLAIDREGREIVLASEIERSLGNGDSGQDAYVTITYQETFHEDDRQHASEVESYRRTTEIPEVHVRRQMPSEHGASLQLARIILDDSGKIRDIESAGRQMAGPAIRPGAIGNEELANSSITEEKLAFGSVTENALAPHLKGSLGARGWVRLPFKPVRLPAVRSGTRVRMVEEGHEFTCDVAFAHCGPEGARGSMAIPTPPGVTRIKAFRLAGTASGSVIAQLTRTGWNARENRGESTELLNEIINETSFNKHVAIAEHNRHLDPQLHGLAISVIADAEAVIWLVAAEFE